MSPQDGPARPPPGWADGPGPSRAGPGEWGMAAPGGHPPLAEPTGAAEAAQRSLAVDARPRRQLDRHIDGLATTERGVALPGLRCLDQQPAVGVLDAGLLGGLQIGRLGAVTGADHDDGVAAGAGWDPDARRAARRG